MSEEGKPIYDKTGRQIMVGDVLKIFTGQRRKQYFMYKQVVRECCLGKPNPTPYFLLSHLNLNDSEGYHLPLDGTHLAKYEIVQSIDARFEDRPRLPTPSHDDEGL